MQVELGKHPVNAFDAEAEESEERQRRYELLYAKISAYQQRKGPPPSAIEVGEWQEELSLRDFLRRLPANPEG